MRKQLLILGNAFDADPTYDRWQSEIYEAYLDQDMEADGTSYLEAALKRKQRIQKDHCDKAGVYYYMEDYAMPDRN